MENSRNYPWLSRAFAGAIVTLGVCVVTAGVISLDSQDTIRGYLYLLLALAASTVRFNLPQIVGTVSVHFVFVLIGILELSLEETLVMGCASTAVQLILQQRGRRVDAPALFHIANTAIAVVIAFRVYHAPWITGQEMGSAVKLTLAASILFAMNTFPLAAYLSLSQGRHLAQVWRECNLWTFPYYLAGACLAGLFHFSNQYLAGASSLILLPLAFALYFGSKSYIGRFTVQQSQMEAMAALHMRTIEALALAIEAKDQTAHNHIRRMQLYAVEIGRELGMTEEELEAIRAAAVLHDIGKLAVPEHILCKPGRLTREEFEKVKIHPTVGAEIIERVNFPYPVARMVRFHHERWNGGGYPSGLKGESIPLGARILAAADTFDALITGRPYKSAVPVREAIARLIAEAGISLDPQVVESVIHNHERLEGMLTGPQPATGLSAEALRKAHHFGRGPVEVERPPYFDTIIAARKEVQALLEVSHGLGKSLNLDESLSAFAAGLKRSVPFDSLAIYVLRDAVLTPRFATGECMSLLMAREIAVGQGLTGWCAKHNKPVLNGSPALELGAGDAGKPPFLRSSLVVPLAGSSGTVGVLMLNRRAQDGFDKDNLRLLLAVNSKLASVVENALKYEQAAESATTDFLTGLPNSRALFVQLESEIARARRMGGSLAVLVTDLDGFKAVNDRFGHLAGDDVLRGVARGLRDSCREYDYVARMGGDEFVIIMPGLAEEDIQARVKALSSVVAETSRVACPESQIALSVGVARYPQDCTGAEALLAEADQRMYQAKQTRKLRSPTSSSSRGYDFDWNETPAQ